MSINITPIRDAISSHAKQTGYFQRFDGHEPKSAPQNGVIGAVYLGPIEPLRSASSIVQVSVVVVFNVRIYLNFIQKPEDDIDPKLARVVDAMMTKYIGDFDLGATVRNVDVFGESGYQLRAEPGYLDIDNKKYRVVGIQLPVIVNDVWTEAN